VVYWARYAAGRRTSGPAVDRPAALAETLGSHDTVVGSGAALYAEVFGSAADPAAPRPPDVAALIKPVLPVLRAEEPAPLLAPLYLRRPDAVPPGAPKSATPAGQAS
jgi:tRNA A37 threonylcarbamoyladenosine modification protein TsaB